MKTRRWLLSLHSFQLETQERGYLHLQPFAAQPPTSTSLLSTGGEKAKPKKQKNKYLCVCVCLCEGCGPETQVSQARQLCGSRKVLLLCLLVHSAGDTPQFKGPFRYNHFVVFVAHSKK